MIKVMFVCHGNICRSPMAEFVFKDMIEKERLNDKVFIASSATSTEEIGNGIHHGTRQKLAQVGIFPSGKRAVQLTSADYNNYDYILAMDSWNIKNINRIIKNDPEKKVKRLLDITNNPRDIADPWYTGNFDVTYDDILEGCNALLKLIKNQL